MDGAACISRLDKTACLVCAQVRGLVLGHEAGAFIVASPGEPRLSGLAQFFFPDAVPFTIPLVKKGVLLQTRALIRILAGMVCLGVLGVRPCRTGLSHIRYCNPKLQPPPSLFFPIKIATMVGVSRA